MRITAFAILSTKLRKSFTRLLSLVHLMIFMLAVFIGVMSFNFEVFRVIRFGDLLIIFFAFLIGVHWYGQRMLENGYKNGVKSATQLHKTAKRK